MKILVTGAFGYLGRVVLNHFQSTLPASAKIFAFDVRVPIHREESQRIQAIQGDICGTELDAIVQESGITHVVHLATLMPSPKGDNRELAYQVDVEGTRNLLEACCRHGVEHLIVSSSGAAYGYHQDNPVWIKENDVLRANASFAYAWHKRLVEEMLEKYRSTHPDLKQTIFRIGTILGETTDNQITALFHRPRLLKVAGSDSPFVFIWDKDVAGCFRHALMSGNTGIYNVAGDGCLTIVKIADILGKKTRTVSPQLLSWLLRTGRRLGVSRYGPEQLDFYRYRPVLDNEQLKTRFGYTPQLSSAETFKLYAEACGLI